MSDQRSQVAQDLLDYLESVKDKLATEYEKLGLGKDQLLRVHNSIDANRSVIASAGAVEGHDLNVDLAASPEDHPAVQGQVSTPINTDDNVNEQSPVAPAQPVISGAPQDAPASVDESASDA